MRLFHLFICGLLLLVGGSADAGETINNAQVVAALRERLEGNGFTLVTDAAGKPADIVVLGRSGPKRTFRFGDALEHEVPKYKAQGGQWVQAGTYKTKIDPAHVTFQVVHIDPQKKLPISLGEVVRKPRKAWGREIKLGKAPKTDVVKHEGQWTETFESERRSGAAIERLIVNSTAPGTRIVGSADRKSLTSVEPWPAPQIVQTKILYHYQAERFGEPVEKVLLIRIRVDNAPKDRIPLRPIDYGAMENAALQAIAEAAGLGQPVDRQATEEPLPEVPPAEVALPEEQPESPPLPSVVEEEPPQRTSFAQGYPDVIAVGEQANALQERLVEIRAQLRAGVVAQAEEQALLANVRRTLVLMDRNDPNRSEYENWIEELKSKIADLDQEREDLLREARKKWTELHQTINEVIGIRHEQAGIREELEAFRDEFELREQLSELQLLLAAGKTDAFNARLPDALRNERLAQSAMQLRIADYLEREKIPEALYAARAGGKRHPDNEVFAFYVRDLEAGFLDTIAAKAVDDGARLRLLWDEYAGEDRGMLWNAFFGGLKHAVHGVTGTRARLESVLKTGVDRAAMEHNGIEMMRRLRKQGLSFDEIEQLDFYELRERMIKIAPERGSPTDRTVENFEVALAVAFQNEDIKRLRAPGKALMEVSHRSYYGAEEFDDHWGGVLDVISAKNVLMIFGPAATLGTPGWLARFASRMGAPGRLVTAASSQRAAGMTIGEWVYSAPSAQRVAQAIANSRAGPSLANARHALAALRYHDKTLVRWGTAGADVAANWLFMEGAGWAGEQVGGEYGRIAGELMSGFVGLPGVGSTARLHGRVKRSQAALEQAQAQAPALEKALKALKEMRALEQARARAPLLEKALNALKKMRGQVHDAAESLARVVCVSRCGDVLSKATREALERAATTADDVAKRARLIAKQRAAGGEYLVQGTADEAEALAASARAALAGRADDALGASRAARAINKRVQSVRRTVETAETKLTQLRERIQKGPTLTIERAPRAPGSKPPIHGDPVPPRTSIPRVGAKPDAAPPLPPPAPPASAPALPIAEFEKSALKLMKAKRYKDAAAVLNVALRDVSVRYSHAEGVIARLRAAVEEAVGAVRARLAFANRKRNVLNIRLAGKADEAVVAFRPAEREAIENYTANLKIDDLEKLPGAGNARLIRDQHGNPALVWKPGNRATPDLEQDGQIAAEILNSRLGRRLGLRVPHAEPLMIEGRRGVVIRWIPGTTNFESLSQGAQAALKDQVAAFRPLNTVMGNYDLRAANYVVDRAGRVWAIDAGQSLITTPPYKLAVELEARRKLFTIRGDVSDSVNWTRWLRDWYTKTDHRSAGRMHTLASGADMRQSALGLQRVTPAQLKADISVAVAGAPKSAERAEDILSTLLERQKNLKPLLNEHWPGALP